MADGIFSRTANALVAATASTLPSGEPACDPHDLAESLDDFEIRSPGSWVGGVLSISDAHVVFKPNMLNRATYGALASGINGITVPFTSIRSVEVESSFLTNIIRIRTNEFLISARCFGAKSVAARISANAPLA
jgi:hypothetical protein